MTTPKFNQENQFLQKKYALTALLYDILDYPYERQYRHWRPRLVQGMSGQILELGVGTGHNLMYYGADANVLGIDLSQTMLTRAAKKAKSASCTVELRHEDATSLVSVSSEQFDWVLSTFMCCVMPDHLQPLAVEQFQRVLKPGGRFHIVEVVYSKNKNLRLKQKLIAPLVEKIYGARFDRNTLTYIQEAKQLEIQSIDYLKDDTYLMIKGIKTAS